MVGGKRVKTIDVHAHCHFHEAGALLGAEADKVMQVPVNGADEAFIEIDKRLAVMDAQAVDMEVLSINPFWYNRDRDLAAADREDPERKAGGAVRLKARPVRGLCLAHAAGARSRGAGTRDRGEEAGIEGRGDRRRGQRRGILRSEIPSGVGQGGRTRRALFIHPQGMPELKQAISGNGWLANTIGNPLETTIALSHLIFRGDV
jgi:hypothetical protein